MTLEGKYGIPKDPYHTNADKNVSRYFKNRSLNLYPSQLRFLFSIKPEVLMSGGFGCVVGATKLLTTDGEVEIEKLVEENKAPVVLSFNGKDFEWIQAEVPYLKSYEETLEIKTDDGKTIEVANDHYFLTWDGWKAASSCVVGERLLGYSASPVKSNWERDQLIHVEDVFHSTKKSEDYLNDYQKHRHLYDEQLPSHLNIFQDVVPLLNDVHGHNHQNWLKGVGDCVTVDIPAYQLLYRLSKQNLKNPAYFLNLLQYRSSLEICENVPQCSYSKSNHNGKQSALEPSRPYTSLDIHQDYNSKDTYNSKDDNQRASSDQASYNTPLVSSIIQQISHNHHKKIYDIGVPIHHNYVAHGLINHNCGKTLVLCVKAAIEGCKPGNIVMLCRKQYTDLEATTLRTLIEGDGKSKPILPYGCYRYSKSERRIDLIGGGTIMLVGFDDPMKMGSYNAGCVLVDEAWQIEEKEYNALGKRCRNDVGCRQIMLVTNPSTYGHFLYRKFYSEKIDTCESIEACSEENVYLPKDYIENHLKKQANNQQEYDNILMGKWVSMGKLVYPQWNNKKFVRHVDNKTYPYYYVSIDYGYTNQMALLFAGVDEDNRIHILDEFYQSHCLHNDVFEKLKDWDEKSPTLIIDPSAAMFAAELQDREYEVIKADNAIPVGVGRVRNMIANEKITVEPKCINFLNEMNGYTLESNGKPVKIHDHLMDGLRYLCNYLQSPEMNMKIPKLYSYEDWATKEKKRLIQEGNVEELIKFRNEVDGNNVWFNPVQQEN